MNLPLIPTEIFCLRTCAKTKSKISIPSFRNPRQLVGLITVKIQGQYSLVHTYGEGETENDLKLMRLRNRHTDAI